MRFQKPGKGVPLIHCCLFDRQCRQLECSPYLYLHFLKDKRGDSVHFLVWFDRTA